MTITRQIAFARQSLPGNPGAYARSMSAAIRAAASNRAASALRKAIAEDKAERHFVGLDTACPLAAEA